jgi:hypothetical protein
MPTPVTTLPLETPARSESDAIAAAAAELRAHDRETFLGSARALPACARELDRLADDIARRITAAGASEEAGTPPEVRRSPGRCIVQLGPVALTLSWLRSRSGTVAEGRLMIVEWEGTVGRGGGYTPERYSSPNGRAATLVREEILMADATSERDWLWRQEEGASGECTSPELAERCVASLLSTLRAQQK